MQVLRRAVTLAEPQNRQELIAMRKQVLLANESLLDMQDDLEDAVSQLKKATRRKDREGGASRLEQARCELQVC